ncbi:type II toxin-antitoxin system Phd/YefM family antitoxin [Allostreptomyces psammosilenae]|uniref:Antitoxin n=1 Tax=Allostreptomyces psammosilenae TaxID=1892865 RepID=A0A852ZVZ9_9ACTN|nr:type II toxin-antitoxin system prevent-host-death family antitoxin [Allostreptomyces psammosilenae]NYI05430.1 prevent-host-death family protein [Allostreptomyces psammosilenae]
MESIGLRELSHHTARVVARVRDGETIQVTDHGKPVLRLVPENPQHLGWRERLIAAGELIPATDPTPFATPLVVADPGRSVSDALSEMRDQERW